MKHSRIVILLMFVAFASCTKDSEYYKSAGTITGIDGTMCGCCGGYIIYIDNVRYLINSMSNDTGLDLRQETFPLAVMLDWQQNNPDCLNRIDVLRMKKE